LWEEKQTRWEGSEKRDLYAKTGLVRKGGENPWGMYLDSKKVGKQAAKKTSSYPQAVSSEKEGLGFLTFID